MGKRKEGSMIAAAVLAFRGCAAVMAAQMSGPEVPEAVTPPAGRIGDDAHDGAVVNSKATVKYSADYVFFKP
jgi:hypothetical protein